MDIRTFRARSMRQALQMVRQELGPDAAVLHTREVPRSFLGALLGGPRFEVSASTSVHVPARLTRPAAQEGAAAEEAIPPVEERTPRVPPAHLENSYREKFRDDFRHQVSSQLDQLTSLVEQMCQQNGRITRDLPETLFDVFTDMIEADVDEQIARELIDRVQSVARKEELADATLVKAHLSALLESEVQVAGPILAGRGQHRVVALVGATGVGKTTTIAKLAANYRLRERKRVGLITVDTYRIAAVEQLRTYADIIDLPMEVVATPREMRQAVQRLADLDLILLDTAGRSPRDEVRIQELKSMLAEASADEVHLVLSATAGAKQLTATTRKFAEVGATALLLTKLDEATGLGNLISLVRDCRLPVSYLTNGQNVPDDIQVAERKPFAQALLGLNV